ncbi:hypothetical protein AQ505_18060 [Pedobacter sp. PACM 27299]|uniref:YybH family protein n=1 Tax=Pedobacter sp. PACM 27299 TaxID=1727164 RepID=UPI00070655F9|nr:nuclear transport factor 2 family protein [Pedobacter sp. PACM 27299]ALL07224.1 hypothetical protein AQ505_18060 [Pedobacter sp. PACM 27299]
MSSVSFFKRQEEEAIRLSRMDSNMAISNQDVAGVAKYWMDDIVVISGEGGQYLGKPKLLKAWKEMFASKPPLFERIPSSIVIGDSGILAWETGAWSYKTEPFRGNYSAMWRKINGVWLTQSELFVSLD